MAKDEANQRISFWGELLSGVFAVIIPCAVLYSAGVNQFVDFDLNPYRKALFFVVFCFWIYSVNYTKIYLTNFICLLLCISLFCISLLSAPSQNHRLGFIFMLAFPLFCSFGFRLHVKDFISNAFLTLIAKILFTLGLCDLIFTSLYNAHILGNSKLYTNPIMPSIFFGISAFYVFFGKILWCRGAALLCCFWALFSSFQWENGQQSLSMLILCLVLFALNFLKRLRLSNMSLLLGSLLGSTCIFIATARISDLVGPLLSGTSYARAKFWKAASDVVLNNHFFTGGGSIIPPQISSFEIAAPPTGRIIFFGSVHNAHLQNAMLFGYPFAILFLGSWLYVTGETFRLLARTIDNSNRFLPITCFSIFSLNISLMCFSLFQPSGLSIYLLLAGLGFLFALARQYCE